MCEADDEMHCVVAHLVRRFLRLEIKRAETALAACGGVKFWVDIKDALAVDIDYSQIGITRTLRFAIIREWKSAVHAGCGVQQLAQTIFKMAAHFVDAIDMLNRAARRIQLLYRFIASCANRFCDALIHWIACVKREHFLPGGIKNDFAEWDAPQLLIFIQQPRDELIYRRVRSWR